MKKKKTNKGGKPRLKPGEDTKRLTINMPESLAKKIYKAADKKGIGAGEWLRRIAAKELGVEL